MAVRLRLARHGSKKRPYYYIVAADSRAPRDGHFIERIGSYNPMTNPATINLDFDKALAWIHNGAQPSDTVKRILSYKGVFMKKHLLDGVKKGAFDEATAEMKYQKWLEEKEQKIRNKVSDLELKKRNTKKEILAAEAKVNELRAAEIAKKRLAVLEAQKVIEAQAQAQTETITTETEKVETVEVIETVE
ncbi:MAG: 30S ribosomal protein S16 [Bacteroidales bacterium]|jgi:small subunit ribosomal protein S16|nr:30S ribosomal protein S16 [Bacteroidales bacterium]